jgi:hypothetical protein
LFAGISIAFITIFAGTIGVSDVSSAECVSIARIEVVLTDVNGEDEGIAMLSVSEPVEEATNDPKTASRDRSDLATHARIVAGIGLAELSVRRRLIRLVVERARDELPLHGARVEREQVVRIAVIRLDVARPVQNNSVTDVRHDSGVCGSRFMMTLFDDRFLSSSVASGPHPLES